MSLIWVWFEFDLRLICYSSVTWIGVQILSRFTHRLWVKWTFYAKFVLLWVHFVCVNSTQILIWVYLLTVYNLLTIYSKCLLRSVSKIDILGLISSAAFFRPAYMYGVLRIYSKLIWLSMCIKSIFYSKFLLTLWVKSTVHSKCLLTEWVNRYFTR